MSDRRLALLNLLSDGGFRSGSELGAELGIGRAAVWKIVEQLTMSGIPLNRVRGKGYKLSRPIELLDADKILQQILPVQRKAVSHIEILDSVTSTNSYLLNLARNGIASGYVCLAEEQTAGKGRRGREWVSPLAQNLYLSLHWRFGGGLDRLGGLSAAVAVAVFRALTDVGVPHLHLKWPNDILLEGRKVAGILIEAFGEASDRCSLIIGIGINVSMEQAGSAIEQPWNSIARYTSTISRNTVVARVLDHLLRLLEELQAENSEAICREWNRYDAYRGERIALQQEGKTIEGIGLGIDSQGRLQLRQGNGTVSRHSVGEVSLRPGESYAAAD